MDLFTNETVAIKEVIAERGISCSTLREIVLLGQLQRMNHPNIIKIKNVMTNQGEKTFSRELILDCAETDLNKYLRNLQVDMSVEQIKNFTGQILQGLSYCHSINIIHRDIKPSNILLKDGVLKIADFGLARAITPSKEMLSPDVVTRCYRCPELLLGESKYSFGIDIWSVGCILAELTTRMPLFRGATDVDQLHKIFRILGTPNDDYWPGFTELKGETILPNYEAKDLMTAFNRLGDSGHSLLVSLLQCNPNKRPNTQQASCHCFLESQIVYVRSLRKIQLQKELSLSRTPTKFMSEQKFLSIASPAATKQISPVIGTKRNNNTAVVESMNFKDTLQVIKDSVLRGIDRSSQITYIDSNSAQHNTTAIPTSRPYHNVTFQVEPIKPIPTTMNTTTNTSTTTTSNIQIPIPVLSRSESMTPKSCLNMYNDNKENTNNDVDLLHHSLSLSNSKPNVSSFEPQITTSNFSFSPRNESKDNNNITTRPSFLPNFQPTFIHHSNGISGKSLLKDENDEDDAEITKSLDNVFSTHDDFSSDFFNRPFSACSNTTNGSNRPMSGFQNHHSQNSNNNSQNHNTASQSMQFKEMTTENVSKLPRSYSQTSLTTYASSSSSGRTDREDMSTLTIIDSASKSSSIPYMNSHMKRPSSRNSVGRSSTSTNSNSNSNSSNGSCSGLTSPAVLLVPDPMCAGFSPFIFSQIGGMSCELEATLSAVPGSCHNNINNNINSNNATKVRRVLSMNSCKYNV